MRNLKMELIEKFGMTGDGKLTKKIPVKEFEDWGGFLLNKRKANEYGTEDAKIYIEDEEEFKITLEIDSELITHCYY